MTKTKKYLVVVKHYTIRKREPDLELVALCDTETEALKKCRRQYSDIIEVWAESWPQDPVNHNIKLFKGRNDVIEANRKWHNLIEDWMKEHKK